MRRDFSTNVDRTEEIHLIEQTNERLFLLKCFLLLLLLDKQILESFRFLTK